MTALFITMLIGLAFDAMTDVSKPRESISELLLVVVFFLTTTRFFIGNNLHLVSDELLQLDGLVWFYDLLIIIGESIVLIQLGKATTADPDKQGRVDFFDLLVLLFAIDVSWILSQIILARVASKWRAALRWRRRTFPTEWLYLNVVLLMCLIGYKVIVRDIFDVASLVFVVLLSAGAFVVDLILIDYKKVLQ